MKNLSRLVCLLLLLTPLRLFAQQKPNTPVPSPPPQPTALDKTTSDDSNDEENKPFKPYWDNQLELSSNNQQAGQNTTSLTYTGTQHFDEGGDFLSLEGSLGRQKVEGVGSSTGTLTLNGGLGVGIFTPSLSVGLEGGESALKQFNGNLSLAFQFWEPFALTLSTGGNVGSHQGDVSAFYPNVSGLVQIDTASLNSSLGAAFVPWDWWTISLTLEGEFDDTYQLQLINHPMIKVPVAQTDKIASLTLGMDFTLFKDFVLGVSPEIGQEYFPAGAVYSPLAGGMVQNSTAKTQNFTSGTISLSLNFK